jgi:hypothetical protein
MDPQPQRIPVKSFAVRCSAPFLALGCAALLLLAGCAGTAPTSLRAPANQAGFVTLAEPFAYEVTATLSSVRWRHTLSYGVYRARGQDDGGTYYQGPPGCLRSLLTEGSWVYKDGAVGNASFRRECGIYVPLGGTAAPRVYVVQPGDSTPTLVPEPYRQSQRPPAQAAGVSIGLGLVNAIVAAERGRLMMFPDQPDGERLRQAVAAGAPRNAVADR